MCALIVIPPSTYTHEGLWLIGPDGQSRAQLERLDQECDDDGVQECAPDEQFIWCTEDGVTLSSVHWQLVAAHPPPHVVEAP